MISLKIALNFRIKENHTSILVTSLGMYDKKWVISFNYSLDSVMQYNRDLNYLMQTLFPSSLNRVSLLGFPNPKDGWGDLNIIAS